MFKLMLRYNNQGDFVDTVFSPRDYKSANALLQHYRKTWEGIHTYILVEVAS